MEKPLKNNVHLILRQTNALSGTPRILRRQALALAQHGQNVSVISESFHSELTDNPKIKCLKTWKWPKNTLFQRQWFDWQAKRLCSKSPKSLVVGHGDTLHQDILFLHTCVHLGADVYPGPHNDKNLSIPFHRMIFEKGSFNVLVCNSKMMKNDLQKRFNVNKPTHIFYPGHDQNLINTINPTAVNEIRQKIKAENKLVLGVITSGNLENRGAFALIKAVAQLPLPERQKVSVLIVGKEGKPEKVYKLAGELGIGEQVFWMEPRLDVANLIAAVDIVVHAAKIEAFGMSVLESMALARPIIATSTVGCAELFPEVQKDYIIERQDPAAIAEKLKSLINQDNLRAEMGKLNQEIARLHTWEKYDENFLNLIREYGV